MPDFTPEKTTARLVELRPFQLGQAVPKSRSYWTRLAIIVSSITCIAGSPIHDRTPPPNDIEVIHRDQLGVFPIDNGRTRVLATSSLIKPGAVGHRELGVLLTFANDEVQPGSGFKLHPHENVEVITIVLQGHLDHKDSAGHSGRVSAGEIGLMSAGTGVKHSEFGDPNVVTRSVTIWLKPRTMNKTPHHAISKPVDRNGWLVIAAEHGAPLIVDQDARVLMRHLGAHKRVRIAAHPGRMIYIGVVEGELLVGEQRLVTPERLILRNGKIDITSEPGATLVMVDVPTVR